VSVRRRIHRDQAGVSALEMTVVVALLAVVLTMAFEAIIGYQGATAGNQARLRNLEEAQVVMAVVTKDLRTAISFSSLGASDVTFLGHLNTGPTAPPNMIRLYVDGQGRLLEAVTPPDNPTANPITYTGVPTTRVVGEGVVSTGSLLDFRDTADTTTTTTTEVTSVVVSLSVNLPAAVTVPATVLSSRVFLPNVAAAGVGA
jgi:type II secretory pathway pseudopilin PulG